MGRKGLKGVRVRMVIMPMGTEYIVYKVQLLGADGDVISAYPLYLIRGAVPIHIIGQVGVNEVIRILISDQKAFLAKIE